MRKTASSYRNHRFPVEFISHAVGLVPIYPHFRGAEDLLAERGIEVSYLWRVV